jgi:hypothetical protein
MQDERLYFVSKSQGFLVIAEFMIFQIQLADRLAYTRMGDTERAHFIQTMARRSIEILADNRADLQGEGDYRDDFLEIFNQRLSDYAEFSFDNNGPGYHFYRYIGKKIGLIMGNDQDNKWAIDQVMEIEAPKVYTELKKSLDMLYG